MKEQKKKKNLDDISLITRHINEESIILAILLVSGLYPKAEVTLHWFYMHFLYF